MTRVLLGLGAFFALAELCLLAAKARLCYWLVRSGRVGSEPLSAVDLLQLFWVGLDDRDCTFTRGLTPGTLARRLAVRRARRWRRTFAEVRDVGHPGHTLPEMRRQAEAADADYRRREEAQRRRAAEREAEIAVMELTIEETEACTSMLRDDVRLAQAVSSLVGIGLPKGEITALDALDVAEALGEPSRAVLLVAEVCNDQLQRRRNAARDLALAWRAEDRRNDVACIEVADRWGLDLPSVFTLADSIRRRLDEHG